MSQPPEGSERFDVVIVGSRCAGTAAACAYAQAGRKVVVLDRASFPSDTLSTHVLFPSGVDELRRMGALGRILGLDPALLSWVQMELPGVSFRERFRPVRQCMVRTHPVTGRKSLYLSSHAGGIVGWPMPEARGYLRDLIEHATQREFVYTHKWRLGDLVMWDNRQTMHRARPFPADEPRDMRRTTLAGDGPTAMQIAA